MTSGHRSDRDRLMAVLKINIAVFIAEVLVGYSSGSLSMLSDSFHISLHVFASVIALVSEYSFFGIEREKLKHLSAWVNIALFFPLAASIGYEAYERLKNPLVISLTSVFFLIAVIGLIANLYTIQILHEAAGEEHSKNENRFLLLIHMVFDALGSVIVIIGGIIIVKTGLYWPDPVASFILAGLIIIGAIVMSWKLFHGRGHIH